MSKANRIKGKFDPVLGARNPSQKRVASLVQRNLGITERHEPTLSLRIVPYLTKTTRKAMKKAMKKVKGYDSKHPSAIKDEKQNIGYAKIMGLISTITTTPEVSLV